MIFNYKTYLKDNKIDFNKLEKDFYYYKSMMECPQNPKYHKEGDVWEHTKLVLNEINFSSNDYNNDLMFLSVLLHDVAKPLCTKEVDGELETKKHSVLGARMTREILWGINRIWDVSWKLREEVSNMILLHSLPVHFLNKSDPDRYIYGSSQVLKNCNLRDLALYDNNGRICEDDRNCSLEAVHLFDQYCAEKGCLNNPKIFPSSNTRFKYFFDHKGFSDYDIYEPFVGNVIMMSGIQGSGKNYTIKKQYPDLPIVGLDETREKLDVEFGESEGEVSQNTKEQCRQLMRQKKNFVFNATNTIKANRARWIKLFRQYGYSITIHYVEKPIEKTLKYNMSRDNYVPREILLEKFSKLEVPTLLECHTLVLDVENIT